MRTVIVTRLMRIVLAIAALLLVAGCGGSADDGRRDVVAGFYPQYNNVKQLLTEVNLCSVVNWKA